ncbi:MULE transposase domain [Popillia japonica]|uniref:MULE transposase domain n=1 Tax=Popillia japonica TaxID=7064 RepID=A0AAW1MGB0_POPJA
MGLLKAVQSNINSCTPSTKEALKSHKRFFMDGTFKSCAKQYKQLYTIHDDLGSSSTEIKIVPVLFALLCNKSCATYTKLFQIIKEATSWNPHTVSVDFEQATITSLKTIYPTVAIQGCNFHFNQALWQKNQELGLVKAYKKDGATRNHLRMCAALAYIPIGNIDEDWITIQ